MITYIPIVEDRRPREGEVNCASCDNLGDFNDEHKRGFCMILGKVVSTWHPAHCDGFKVITRDRRIKVVWKGLVYE